MKREKKLYQSVVFGVFVLALSSAVNAQGTTNQDEWDFTVTPFGWMTGLHGNARVGNMPSSVDVKFGDVLESLRMAAMLDLRAQKGRWGVQSNIIWLEMNEADDTQGVHIEAKPKMWFVDLDGFYQITDQWSVLAGIRYFDTTISVKGSGALNFYEKIDENWVDPIMGTEFKTPLSERWSMGARGDIGGFGVGSDLSWQIWAGAEWRFAKKNALAFGWRHLAWDYANGSGADRLEMDTYMTGPYVGVELHF
ncbi:hypothetical protein ACFL3F_01220 [Planctomycetota bacterium]